LVDEEVIQAPAAGLAFSARHAEFPPHEQPATRFAGIHSSAREQVGVLGEELLEQVLGVVGSFFISTSPLLGHQVDAVGHEPSQVEP
jgi:hypothetical protein